MRGVLKRNWGKASVLALLASGLLLALLPGCHAPTGPQLVERGAGTGTVSLSLGSTARGIMPTIPEDWDEIAFEVFAPGANVDVDYPVRTGNLLAPGTWEFTLPAGTGYTVIARAYSDGEIVAEGYDTFNVVAGVTTNVDLVLNLVDDFGGTGTFAWALELEPGLALYSFEITIGADDHDIPVGDLTGYISGLAAETHLIRIELWNTNDMRFVLEAYLTIWGGMVSELASLLGDDFVLTAAMFHLCTFDLEEAIAEAQDLAYYTEVSADGSDVCAMEYWVGADDMDAFEAAILIAEGVLNDLDATQLEVDDATDALLLAIGVFEDARELGTLNDVPGIAVGDATLDLTYGAGTVTITIAYDNLAADLNLDAAIAVAGLPGTIVPTGNFTVVAGNVTAYTLTLTAAGVTAAQLADSPLTLTVTVNGMEDDFELTLTGTPYVADGTRNIVFDVTNPANPIDSIARVVGQEHILYFAERDGHTAGTPQWFRGEELLYSGATFDTSGLPPGHHWITLVVTEGGIAFSATFLLEVTN